MELPFEQEGTVGAVVRIAYEFFAKSHPMDVARLRIVLTPAAWKRARLRPSSVPRPAAGDLRRAA